MALPDPEIGGRRIRQVEVATIGLLGFLLAATVGFHFIEGWSWFDSLYMVMITVTTVGYGEVHELTPPGRVFAMIVIVGGVGIVSGVLLTVTRNFFEGVVEGSIQRAVTRRRVRSQLPRLQDHTIVCGYGRLGKEICKELHHAGRTVVVIDPSEAKVEQADLHGHLWVLGDASDEDVLRNAGIERASSLAIASPSDALNTYITISARDLNPNLHILARATDDTAGKRLKKAGANEAVSPYHVGGLRMAALLIRPAVVDFMDVAALGEFPDLFIEQLVMEEGSALAGQSLREGNFSANYRVMVLSIKHPEGKQTFLPPADDAVQPGDLVIVAGHRADLDRFAAALHGTP